MKLTDFVKIFDVFTKYNIDYIVVGGISAVLHGAPVTTYDLDVIHDRRDENISRLISALKELNAHYRTRRDIKIKPEESALQSKGHHLLENYFGI